MVHHFSAGQTQSPQRDIRDKFLHSSLQPLGLFRSAVSLPPVSLSFLFTKQCLADQTLHVVPRISVLVQLCYHPWEVHPKSVLPTLLKSLELVMKEQVILAAGALGVPVLAAPELQPAACLPGVDMAIGEWALDIVTVALATAMVSNVLGSAIPVHHASLQ